MTISEMHQELAAMEDEYAGYHQLFMESDGIDDAEQAELDELASVIQAARMELEAMEDEQRGAEAEAAAAQPEVEAASGPGSVTVLVIDKRERPVFDAEVRLQGKTKKTNSNGQADFPRVNPGEETIEVTVDVEGGVRASETIVVAAETSRTETIKLNVTINSIVGNLEDDDFWEEFENRAIQNMTLWLTGEWAPAIENMDTFLHKKEDRNDAMIVWSSTKDLLGMIPGAGIPIAVANTAVELSAFIPGQAMSVEDFISGMRNSYSETSKSVRDKKHPIVTKIQAMPLESEAGDPGFRARMDRAVSRELAALPNKNKMMKNMVNDWVKSSGDTDWISQDYEGPQSGYLYSQMTYKAKSRNFRFSAPCIDDIENPGVLDAMKEGYGANSSLTVVELPTKGTLKWYTDTPEQDDNEGYVKFILEGTGRPGKFRVQQSFRHHLPFHSGTPDWMPEPAKVIKLFEAQWKKFKVSDLVME